MPAKYKSSLILENLTKAKSLSVVEICNCVTDLLFLGVLRYMIVGHGHVSCYEMLVRQLRNCKAPINLLKAVCHFCFATLQS